MQSQGSIAKDTLAVCAAAILLVALLLGAAALAKDEPAPIRTAEKAPASPDTCIF